MMMTTELTKEQLDALATHYRVVLRAGQAKDYFGYSETDKKVRARWDNLPSKVRIQLLQHIVFSTGINKPLPVWQTNADVIEQFGAAV